MANCNECTKLDIKIEKEGTINMTNHICSTHNMSVRYTGKRFKGYIWPCTECNGADFVKK